MSRPTPSVQPEAGISSADLAQAVHSNAPVTGIEVDNSLLDDSSENDSAYGDTNSSHLTSLSESVTQYKYENGRRYHAFREGSYPVPNDEQEANREDMKHHCTLLLTGGKTHLAPIGEHPQAILDLGTGTGIWAMDIADEFPSAKIIGTDLSPIQPTWVPSNLSFELDDLESEWAYQPNSFDFIHVRYMFSSVKDWDRMLQQAMRVLKPGGWIELVELDIIPFSDDNSLPEDSQIYRWFNLIAEAGSRFGFNLRIAQEFETLLKRNGYANVDEKRYQLPCGPWPRNPRLKEIGLFNREQLLEGLQGIALGMLTRGLGWTTQEVEVFLVSVRQEMLNRKVHVYWHTFFTYGQKPLSDK